MATWCYHFIGCLEITLVVHEDVVVDYASNLFQINSSKIKLLILQLNLCFECIDDGNRGVFGYCALPPSFDFAI